MSLRMGKNQISIKLKINSNHSYYMNRFLVLSNEELKKYQNKTSNIVGLPTKIERVTVLRSPHVDKKARDQFERRTLRTVLGATPNIKESSLDKVLNTCKANALGVSVECTLRNFNPNIFRK